MKTIAYYLPQFHRIPENDEWWGEGFTEWVNVKNAVPLFPWHLQPRVPLNNYYYDLSDVGVMRWQSSLAKQYGLYGFCFYHYWFGDRPLLEKPILNYLHEESIDFPFCLCWANESWTNGWAKPNSEVILEQKYGSYKEWEEHFNFLLPFLKDRRYIKDNGKPLLLIYRPYLCPDMCAMLDYWKTLAKQNGLEGLTVASQRYEEPHLNNTIYDYMDYHIDYQPDMKGFGLKKSPSFAEKVLNKVNKTALNAFNKDLALDTCLKNKPACYDYDEMWKRIIEALPEDSKRVAGAFVNWDNTPRYRQRGSVFSGVTPEKFEHYLRQQIEHVKKEYSTDYLFLFAWNEWAEGGYLEPDAQNGYKYLMALKNALSE